MAEQYAMLDPQKEVEKQRQAYETEFKAKSDLAIQQAQEREKTLAPIYQEQADIQEKYGKKIGEIGKQLEQPYEIPKESMQNYAALGSLVAILATSLGGAGKQSAMATLASMNGLLKGYQSGRKDVVEAARKEFDTNIKRLQAQSQQLQNELSMYLEKSKLGEKSALEHLNVANAISAGGVWQQLNAGGMYDKAAQTVNQINQINNSIKFHKEQMDMQHARLQFEREKFEYEKRKPLAKTGDFGQFLKDNTGATLSPKDTDEVRSSVQAIGQAYSLIGKVREHPDWVGRSGQIQQFFNRYVDSLANNKPLPADDANLSKDRSGQEALVFAKEYAAYLVNYERALAGGARGFTVQFQKRFNELLRQEQFNPKGFENLMDQQINEISKNAQVKSPGKITKQNLSNMAMQIYSDDPYVMRGYSRESASGSKESAGGGGQVASKTDIDATMKATGLPREEVIKRLKAKGYRIEGE